MGFGFAVSTKRSVPPLRSAQKLVQGADWGWPFSSNARMKRRWRDAPLAAILSGPPGKRNVAFLNSGLETASTPTPGTSGYSPRAPSTYQAESVPRSSLPG